MRIDIDKTKLEKDLAEAKTLLERVIPEPNEKDVRAVGHFLYTKSGEYGRNYFLAQMARKCPQVGSYALRLYFKVGAGTLYAPYMRWLSKGTQISRLSALHLSDQKWLYHNRLDVYRTNDPLWWHELRPDDWRVVMNGSNLLRTKTLQMQRLREIKKEDKDRRREKDKGPKVAIDHTTGTVKVLRFPCVLSKAEVKKLVRDALTLEELIESLADKKSALSLLPKSA